MPATYDKLSNKSTGHEIQVQSAIEDGAGKNLENYYAKQDGAYEGLYAGESGLAYNLKNRGNSFVVAKYYFRTAGGTADIGSGTAQITKFKGNSIVWNQLITFESKTITNGTGVTAVFDAESGTITLNGTATVTGNILVCEIASGCLNHIFILDGAPSTASQSTYYLLEQYLGWVRDYGSGGRARHQNRDDMSIAIHVTEGDIFDNVVFKPQLFDLTRMYGWGREPATVSAFRSVFPLLYAYNAGTILNFNGTGIKTVGFNAFNSTTGKAILVGGNQYQITGTYTALSYTADNGKVETITPDNDGLFTPTNSGTLTVTNGTAETCVHLTWSGYRNGEFAPYWDSTTNLPDLTQIKDTNNNTLFPNGLMGVNGVSDEVSGSTATLRLGKVELWTLTWYKSGSHWYSETVQNLPSSSYGTTFNIISNIFSAVSASSAELCSNGIGCYSQQFYLHVISLENATTGAEVQEYLQEKQAVAYFETATQTVTLSEALPTIEYKVDDFGTEQLLPLQTRTSPNTTELDCEVAYALNAVDVIRNLPPKVETIESVIPSNASSSNKLVAQSDVTFLTQSTDLTSTSKTITLENHTRYAFGTLTALGITFPASANDGDTIIIEFISGSTATTLTKDTTNAIYGFENIEADKFIKLTAEYSISISKWVVKGENNGCPILPLYNGGVQ